MPRDEKDTIMKALTGALSKDSLKVLGISGVRVAKALPTELDTLKQHVDMLWQMDDGRLSHLEFQTNGESSLHRFLMYDARLAEQYKERIRTVILYHGNVKEAPEELNIGTAQYRVENVFLGRFDGDAALDAVERHLNTHEWTPEDRWRLALAMNMRFTKRSREEAVESVLRLVRSIAVQQERDFVVAGILSLTERVLTESERIRVRRELVQVSQIAKEIQEDTKRQIAKKLLLEGLDALKVARLTELEIEEVNRISQNLQ